MPHSFKVQFRGGSRNYERRGRGPVPPSSRFERRGEGFQPAQWQNHGFINILIINELLILGWYENEGGAYPDPGLSASAPVTSML